MKSKSNYRKNNPYVKFWSVPERLTPEQGYNLYKATCAYLCTLRRIDRHAFTYRPGRGVYGTVINIREASRQPHYPYGEWRDRHEKRCYQAVKKVLGTANFNVTRNGFRLKFQKDVGYGEGMHMPTIILGWLWHERVYKAIYGVLRPIHHELILSAEPVRVKEKYVKVYKCKIYKRKQGVYDAFVVVSTRANVAVRRRALQAALRAVRSQVVAIGVKAYTTGNVGEFERETTRRMK